MKKLLYLLLFFALHASAQTVSIKPEGIQTVTSGTTVTISNGNGICLVNPATTMAALTVTFPSTPNDRDMVVMIFGGTVTTGTVVTLLTMPAAIIGALPTTATVGAMCYMYFASAGKWFRLY